MTDQDLNDLITQISSLQKEINDLLDQVKNKQTTLRRLHRQIQDICDHSEYIEKDYLHIADDHGHYGFQKQYRTCSTCKLTEYGEHYLVNGKDYFLYKIIK